MNNKQNKKLKIIEVTAEHCIRNGYQGTSMDEITAATGMSKATIYRYFKSKEHLISETLNHYANTYTDLLTEIVNDKTLSLIQKVEARFEGLRQLVINDQFNGCYFQQAYSEFCNKDKDITSICTQQSQDKVDLITDLLIKHQVDNAPAKAMKAELIFSGLIAALHITKNTALIDITKEMYLKEILDSNHQ